MSDVERMMKELGLAEEDLDDVVFDEQQAPPEEHPWTAIAKVNTSKTYSQTWFYRNMRSAWNTAQVVKFKALEDNLYTCKFSCLGDWERVMQDGPWNFRGDAVIIASYDGISKPLTVKLETIDIWIQIHDVPDLYSHLVTPLAAKVGEVLFAEPPSHDFVGNFHRVWVRINVLKPLRNAVSMIKEGKRQIYRVKYEKLPDWCAVCGMLGHLFKEHGNGIHPKSALVFKDLRADWAMRQGVDLGKAGDVVEVEEEEGLTHGQAADLKLTEATIRQATLEKKHVRRKKRGTGRGKRMLTWMIPIGRGSQRGHCTATYLTHQPRAQKAWSWLSWNLQVWVSARFPPEISRGQGSMVKTRKAQLRR